MTAIVTLPRVILTLCSRVEYIQNLRVRKFVEIRRLSNLSIVSPLSSGNLDKTLFFQSLDYSLNCSPAKVGFLC